MWSAEKVRGLLSRLSSGIRLPSGRFPSPFRLPAGPKEPLTEEGLRKKALRNITLIAAAGCLLVTLDMTLARDAGTVDLLSRDGRIWMVRPQAGDPPGHLPLRASVGSGEDGVERDVDITLSPLGGEEEASEASEPGSGRPPADRERLEGELAALAADVNEDINKRLVPLPEKLPGGESVRWSLRRESNAGFILLCTLAAAGWIYRRRRRPMEVQEEANRQAILRSLPEFINQMTLLLNAGLVLSRAFERTVEENMKFSRNRENHFYLQMQRICDSVQNTNGSLAGELRSFAKASGVSEMMRIGNLIYDNLSKGASLNEKLERESRQLWLGRKRRFEERGRLAETKMTLPLMIFLCVLIVITVFPALIRL